MQVQVTQEWCPRLINPISIPASEGIRVFNLLDRIVRDSDPVGSPSKKSEDRSPKAWPSASTTMAFQLLRRGGQAIRFDEPVIVASRKYHTGIVTENGKGYRISQETARVLKVFG